MARIVDQDGNRLPCDGRPIYLSCPSQGRFLRATGRTTAQKAKPRPKRKAASFAAPGTAQDAEAFRETIELVNGLLQAFGESPLPPDTNAQNVIDRLRMIVGRLESKPKNPYEAIGASQGSIARRRLAGRQAMRQKPQAKRFDADRTLAGIKALGGNPQAIPPQVWALIVQEGERRG